MDKILGIPDFVFYGGSLFLLVIFFIWGLNQPRKQKTTGADIAKANASLQAEEKAKKEEAEKKEKERRGPDIVTTITESSAGKIFILLTIIALAFCGYVYFLTLWNAPLPEFDQSIQGDTIICAPSGTKAQVTADPVNGPWTFTLHQCIVVRAREYISINVGGTLLWQYVDTVTGQTLYTDIDYKVRVRPYLLPTPTQPTP